METLNLILIALGLVVALMAACYLAAIRWQDIGFVDLGWTFGVGVAGVVYAVLLEDHLADRRLLVAVLAGIWSSRLGWHILARRIAGQVEDARYRALRTHWGDRTRFFVPLLFAAEVPLAILFSLPLLIAMQNPNASLTAWDAAGVAVWIIAVMGEAMADRQLDRFRRRAGNRGKTCREGLWGWSRHPNYFFEWVHWWAYVLMGVGAPYGWVTLVGPVMMFLFLFGITGIPHAERQALARRGDDYRRYQQTTSAFFPWFKRKEID